MEFKRYLADKINWQRQMIGIVGPRGIRKSIMILQRIKNEDNKANSLYVSAANTFEVGGRKKGKKQIEGIKNGWIVKDDIETGHGIFRPLWAFGMTY